MAGRGDSGSELLTVIVVPEGTSRVRRFHVRRAVARRGMALGVMLALLLVAGLADWVRLRLQAVDVARLRAETAAQAQEIERFSGELGLIEERLSMLREFERKVRVIANLPGQIPESKRATDPNAPALGGGSDEPAAEGPPGAAALPVDGATAAAGVAVEAEPAGPEAAAAAGEPHASLEADPEAARLARLRQRAHALADLSRTREVSLADLLERIEGKSQQLAATPSIWPTEGWITSRFGRRISPFTGRPQFHAGVDIAAEFGTPVVAPGRGRVVFAGRKGALGRAVEIQHGWGMKTVYGHLAEILVRKGQTVERGERVGTVGSSGRSTGPHLHYAVVVRGKATNPLDYVFE